MLKASLSSLVREFHDESADLRFELIHGEPHGRGTIHLTPRSRLRIRVPADRIPLVLPLAGRELTLGDHRVKLLMPTVAPLVPAPTLAARMVTFKNSTEPEQFLSVARWKLDELEIQGEPSIPLLLQGERAGQPRRVVFRIKGKQIVGFAMCVEGLTADESIRLQEKGLGGRCRLGCGFFHPVQLRLA
jgi:CRISPR-associated protein Cas6